MDNVGYARALLREADPRIDTAASQVKRGRYAYGVRQSQEAVELSLKAALRLIGVEFPKEHDVSDVLVQNSGKYPSWFSEKIPSMVRVSKELVQKRIPSMYGEEARGKGPGELFTREDAVAASADASMVYKFVTRLLRLYSKG